MTAALGFAGSAAGNGSSLSCSKEEQRRLSKACQAAAAERKLALAVQLLQSRSLGLLIEDKETACQLLKVCLLPKPVCKENTIFWLMPDSERAASGGGCVPAANCKPFPSCCHTSAEAQHC